MRRLAVCMSFCVFFVAQACDKKPVPIQEDTPPKAVSPSAGESDRPPELDESAPEKPEWEIGKGGEIRILLPLLYDDQQDAARELVADGMEDYRKCYNAELAKDSVEGYDGKLHFRADIEDDGSLGNPRVSKAEFEAPELGDCIVEVMKGWKVPETLAAEHDELQFSVGFGY